MIFIGAFLGDVTERDHMKKNDFKKVTSKKKILPIKFKWSKSLPLPTKMQKCKVTSERLFEFSKITEKLGELYGKHEKVKYNLSYSTILLTFSPKLCLFIIYLLTF